MRWMLQELGGEGQKINRAISGDRRRVKNRVFDNRENGGMLGCRRKVTPAERGADYVMERRDNCREQDQGVRWRDWKRKAACP